MANNIGGINGYGNYGVGPYIPNNNSNNTNETEENQGNQGNNYEDMQVDPNKVMDFLASNNYFVDLTSAPAPVDGVVTDPTVADRVAGYMENFETIYAIVEQEFGSRLAPAVMDLVMDKLMGMVN